MSGRSQQVGCDTVGRRIDLLLREEHLVDDRDQPDLENDQDEQMASERIAG